jgi:hypothetical protein
MAYTKKTFLEHTAVYVKDIQWHIRFFEQALNMPVERVQGDKADPIQVWTVGGMQLVAAKDFNGPEGRMAHLGIRTEDVEGALTEIYKFAGVKQMPGRERNWFTLPDGLGIELMPIQS